MPQDRGTPAGWAGLGLLTLLLLPFELIAWLFARLAQVLRNLAKVRRSAPSGDSDEG